MSIAYDIALDIAPTCDCSETALRIRTRSNGVTCYVVQCLTCGRELRAVKKSSSEVRLLADRPAPFDEALVREWREQVQTFYEERTQARRDAWDAQQAAYEAERIAKETQWQEQTEARRRWYSSYLLTPAWRARRARVLQRANGMCEGCLERKATQVHHLTYDHIGHEFLFELVAICDECHTRIHTHKA